MKNIVVFASGYGSNFQATVDAINKGEIKARITGLITNKSEIHVIERAKRNGIPNIVIDPRRFSEPDQYAQVMLKALSKWEPNIIVLAGYLLKIPPLVVDAYAGKIINIHPSLLPKYSGKGYYGLYVHQAVLDNNEKETGCTVHIVDNIYDNGPILAQAKVHVFENDTAQDISKRVRAKELELLPKVISSLINEPV